MQVGRPRKTTKELEVNGTLKAHPEIARARENEPIPTGEIGSPPEKSLAENKADELKEIWIELSAIVAPGVLTNMDRIALEGACLTLYEIRHSDRYSSSMHSTLISYLSRMGMTPADRSRVNVGNKPKGNKFTQQKEWN